MRRVLGAKSNGDSIQNGDHRLSRAMIIEANDSGLRGEPSPVRAGVLVRRSSRPTIVPDCGRSAELKIRPNSIGRTTHNPRHVRRIGILKFRAEHGSFHQTAVESSLFAVIWQPGKKYIVFKFERSGAR